LLGGLGVVLGRLGNPSPPRRPSLAIREAPARLATKGREGTPSPGPYTPDWPPKTDLAK
jgi:hypothetical protein